MKQRLPPKPPGSPPRSAAAPDAFAQAAARLGAQRPLRNARLQQIAAQVQNNQDALAEAALREHLLRQPDDADAVYLMARVALRLGRTGEAMALLQRCLDLAPDFANARFNFANLLVNQHRFDEALAEADRLLRHDDRNPLFRQLKAGILETTGDVGQAASIYQELANENPQRAECWVNCGHALRATGARVECVAAYRRAIECRPSFGMAWWGLANLRTGSFDADDVRAMETQLARSDIAPGDRAGLQYALGKAHEDLGAFDRAFEQYEKGNETMRQRLNYDPATLTRSVGRNKELLTPEFFDARRGAGCPSPDPIFILGRPRSGSTLVEQILSSHSAVEGTAELPYIGAAAAALVERKDVPWGSEYLQALARLPADALTALGEEYLKRAQRHRKLARPFFIDKMPSNFFHAGLIALILPNAKIVDVRRHPAACCLSIFKSFSSKGSLRLAELGRFHRDYVDLMAHFDRVLPGRIFRVTYEALVADSETEIRKLLGYLGLPFEETCLRFHETKRSIVTPSSEQVRRPLFAGAVEHWRNFEPWLGPLIDSLGAVHTDYPEVPAAMR
jgi:tetratricopeptide (TPR) repeat protein